ncbi:DegV family protein [Deinococcus sp. D7000]|uniref:DegV family protein n=1 Tax=Deinococcus radiopugnans ATCC 19172 TaxID=585398 RepID=A0A5C4Y1A4_9DEIO|nr:DegV family protein [Deinococcus radiopugnans]MBB6017674.1 DegV family protein with EDD domain [Deinococcus radiopugnans ATCC 19172]QLG10762.1 DegV family protein [Deinococcus sp. D7000]TNM69256.1 DegV family protein [Deinococcus radiopugnans ATCC 19172]
MIAVLTDSTCDLPLEDARKLGVHIIPLTVHMQERDLLDWQEVDPDAVYHHMKSGGTASTTPVAVAAFAARYRELLDTHDEVVSIHLSGKLSETVEHARRAVTLLNMERRIHVVDSGLASSPLAEAVLAARTAILSGGDPASAVQAARAVCDQIHTEFSVLSLDYLRRSGRIGRTQAFFGNALGLRPILGFEGGELKALRRCKADHAIPDMLGGLRARFGDQPLSISVIHAGRDSGRIQALRHAVTTSGLNVKQARMQLMGPVIGAHVGPGTFGFMARPA